MSRFGDFLGYLNTRRRHSIAHYLTRYLRTHLLWKFLDPLATLGTFIWQLWVVCSHTSR